MTEYQSPVPSINTHPNRDTPIARQPPTKPRTTYHEPTIHTMILLPRPSCASEGRTDVSERSEDTSLMIELAPHLPVFAALKPAVCMRFGVVQFDMKWRRLAIIIKFDRIYRRCINIFILSIEIVVNPLLKQSSALYAPRLEHAAHDHKSKTRLRVCSLPFPISTARCASSRIEASRACGILSRG